MSWRDTTCVCARAARAFSEVVLNSSCRQGSKFEFIFTKAHDSRLRLASTVQAVHRCGRVVTALSSGERALRFGVQCV
jgi:hypothetical protein